MKMILQPRRQYGKVLYWPMCEISRTIASLHRDKRSKTHVLMKREVDALKGIGFEVELVPFLESEA